MLILYSSNGHVNQRGRDLTISFIQIAAMSGDARKALDVCRRATEVAEQQGCSRVGIRHIDAVVKEMFFSLKVMAVK